MNLPQEQLVSLKLSNTRAPLGLISNVKATKYTAIATKEVILAAGAFNTPALLQLSGIGEPAHLGHLGISTRVVRPDVGKNLQDHPLFVMTWSVNTTATVDPIFRGGPVATTASNLWALNHTGKFQTLLTLPTVMLILMTQDL